jgi:hypothetical protein
MISLRTSMTVTLALIVSFSGLSAFDYQAYRPAKLGDIIKEQAPTKTSDWNIVGADFRYRVSPSYSGQFRKIDPGSLRLIGMWVKAVGADPKIAEIFTHEVKVADADASYWLPIQKALIEPLKSEAKAGQKVDLYVTWIGSTKVDFIFLVNEFDAGAKA